MTNLICNSMDSWLGQRPHYNSPPGMDPRNNQFTLNFNVPSKPRLRSDGTNSSMDNLLRSGNN
jgi:hypothetical protein